MTAGGVPHDVLGLSIFVVVYSFICLVAGGLLMISLLMLGERLRYITLISVAVTVGTLASIIQQIHFAVVLVAIKDAQFERAILNLTNPALALGGPAQIWDVVLFYIQYYTYNVEGLLTLFWACALLKSTWNLRMTWLSRWERKLEISSKLLAIIFPAILVGLINIPAVKLHPIILFILSNCILFTTPIIGSILLILILSKYIRTRSRTTELGPKHSWWASLSQRTCTSSTGSPSTLAKSDDEFERLDSELLYSQSIIIRFSIAFMVLIGFEATGIIYNVLQIKYNPTLAASPSSGPDFSVGHVRSDLLEFLPGVTVSLTTFLVFGTTARFMHIYKSLFMCRSPRRHANDCSTRRPVIRHLGTLTTTATTIEDGMSMKRLDSSSSQNSHVRNFSRPTALALTPIEKFSLEKDFRPLDSHKKSTFISTLSVASERDSSEAKRVVVKKKNDGEPDLNKPLPHTPTAKCVQIGFVVRKSVWDRQHDEDGDDFTMFSKERDED